MSLVCGPVDHPTVCSSHSTLGRLVTSVGEGPRDLLVVALSGVQQFISESRSTVDLAASSAIMAELAVTAADAFRRSGVELIFPAPDGPRMSAPNSVLLRRVWRPE